MNAIQVPPTKQGNETRPWTIRRYDERYNSRGPAPDRHPAYLIAFGNYEQAAWVAKQLSLDMSGCEFYYYVEVPESE